MPSDLRLAAEDLPAALVPAVQLGVFDCQFDEDVLIEGDDGALPGMKRLQETGHPILAERLWSRRLDAAIEHQGDRFADTGAYAEGHRRGPQPAGLLARLEAIHAEYVAALRSAPVDEDTRRAYATRVRQYLAWLGATIVDGEPLDDPVARDWAVRDYRSFLQGVAKRKPGCERGAMLSRTGHRRAIGTHHHSGTRNG